MFGFGKHKVSAVTPYDREHKIPVIRASICTGEQVAGFKDKNSGHFEELICLKSDADLEEFLRRYAVDKADIRREW